MDKYFEAHKENKEENNVLYVITTNYERPEGALPIFLKWWQDALKHSGESTENCGDSKFRFGSISSLAYF